MQYLLASAVFALLSGTVSIKGTPAAHVTVAATGNDQTLRTVTDAEGHFRFPPLAFGSYDVEAQKGDLRARLRVDLGGDGATIHLALEHLSQIGQVTVSRSLPIRGSGSDVTLNTTDLTRLPYNNSFPAMLIQLPGAVRGANGVVHLNGDHGVINYQINGVALPQGLNRDIGSEINLNDLSYVDVIEGAYPAQYGLKFGSVLNLTTKSGAGPAGLEYESTAGSNTTLDSTLDYHAPLRGGGYSVSLGGMQTTRGLDPPDFSSPHNNASNVNQYADVAIPAGGNNFTNLTFVHSYDTYQIPSDVNHGEPATTDDNETQDDTFFSLQFRRALGVDGGLTFGPALKVSRIADFGDPVNDWIYGESLNVAPPPFGNGGTPADCADAVKTGVFAPTTCAYSLTDSRAAIDYIVQGDYFQRFGRHELRAGIAYDLARIDKDYAITLQPNNFLAPILTPQTPRAPTTVVDDAPNLGNTYQSYIQDSWHLSDVWVADYGLRYDFFTIRSTAFAAQGFGAFSPRLKLTRSFGRRANLYAYVGRFFEPFSFENVSPQTAALLNRPLQPTIAQFDLKPERDTQLEFGGHLPLGQGQLGFRIWQKNANDLIDDTQVGVTLLHQDINYALGRLSQEALNYVQPLTRSGRAYLSIAHTVSLNKGCETQLLAPCFGSASAFTPADHNQAYSVAGGLLLNNARGGWFSADAEYGSGLSSAICPPGTPGYCEVTPHVIFNAGEGIPIAPRTALTFGVQNLLNDRYYVTLLNAQGNHYAPPRTFTIGIQAGLDPEGAAL